MNIFCIKIKLINQWKAHVYKQDFTIASTLIAVTQKTAFWPIKEVNNWNFNVVL